MLPSPIGIEVKFLKEALRPQSLPLPLCFPGTMMRTSYPTMHFCHDVPPHRRLKGSKAKQPWTEMLKDVSQINPFSS